MRCIIWAAVSSRPQATPEKDSLPSQIEAARQHIAQHEGWAEIADPLVVPGHTRSYLFLADAAHDVPQYGQLMELARRGSVDLLICRSYDRLGRTDALVAQVSGYLRHHGCQILALDMPGVIVEPDEYDGGMDRSSIWTSAIARARGEDEVQELRRRHRFGMQARVRSGKHPGKIPYGYRKGENGLNLYEPEAEVVRLVCRWFSEGMSAWAIANRLAVENPAHLTEYRIRYMLRNPTYCGMVSYKRTDGHGHVKPRSEWLLAEGQHPAIIPRQEWEAIQLDYERRAADRRSPYSKYPLSGSVFCGHCGGRMRTTIVWGKFHSYRYYICGAEGCQRNSVNAVALEDAVAGWIWRSCQKQDLAAMVAEMAGNQENHEAERRRLQAAVDRIEKALDRYAEDYELGLLGREEFYCHKGRLEGELDELHGRVAALEETRIDPEQVTQALDALLSMTDAEHADKWRQQENVPAIKAALRAAGVRIAVKGGQVDITLDLS